MTECKAPIPKTKDNKKKSTQTKYECPFHQELSSFTHGTIGGLGGIIIISPPPSPTPPLTHLIS